MVRVHTKGDESGDFKFGRDGTSGVSEYLLVTTVTYTDCAVLDSIIGLQRDLHWEGRQEASFHAYKDHPKVRDRFFQAVTPHDFRVDSTIILKSKAYGYVQETNLRVWKTLYYYHMRHVLPVVATAADELLAVAASIDTKMRPKDVREAFRDVVEQVTPCPTWRSGVWDAAADPGLQLADYCAWAVGRKFETGRTDYYDRIKEKVKTEYRLF